MKELLLRAVALLLACTLAGCATSQTDALLEMESSAEGYRLGSEFRPEAPENGSFEYRGRQAGHVVYHRKAATDGDRWKYTDILLHVGPEGMINKIVLLRQFSSLQEASDFYDREYRRQRDRYHLTEDSGNRGNIRFAKVEAYPDRATWEAAHRRYREEEEDEPFRYYYHPLIAGRTASFVYVRGVPTVALIYEGHGYPGGAR